MNIGTIFSNHARYHPNHLAVVFGHERLTHLEFNKSINRIANALLGIGVRKGDKVATILPNCSEQLGVYWAAGKIGALTVPFSVLLRAGAFRTLLQNSDSWRLWYCMSGTSIPWKSSRHR